MTDKPKDQGLDARLKESLSALMDDEANELELQRVLSQADEEALKNTWQRYHLVRDVMHGREHSAVTSAAPKINIDVSASVAAAIAQETEAVASEGRGQRAGDKLSGAAENQAHYVVQPPRDRPYSGKRWLGAGAIAASLMLSVMFLHSGEVGQPDRTSPLIAQSAIESESAGQLQVVASTGEQRQPRMVSELNDQELQRFNHYLLRHAEHRLVQPGQGLIPLARVASVNAVGI